MKRTITSVSNPQYSRTDNSSIDCVVTCLEVPGNHPFTARADDTELHGRQLFAELIAGIHGAITPFPS